MHAWQPIGCACPPVSYKLARACVCTAHASDASRQSTSAANGSTPFPLPVDAFDVFYRE